VNHSTNRSTPLPLVLSLLLLFSCTLIAQDNLPGSAAAPASFGPFPGFRTSSDKPSSERWNLTSPSLPLLPQVFGSNPSGSNAPKQPNWARRHVILLSGLAMTGAGSAMMATGGNSQASGCLAAGINGAIECTTVPTWGSGRHIGGLLLVCAGVPIAIWGLFKHH